jgi:hypothetical protein
MLHVYAEGGMIVEIERLLHDLAFILWLLDLSCHVRILALFGRCKQATEKKRGGKIISMDNFISGGAINNWLICIVNIERLAVIMISAVWTGYP